MKVEAHHALIVFTGALAGGILFMFLQPLVFVPLRKAIIGA